MVSVIDPAVIVDDVDVSKALLRAQLAAARDEITSLQSLIGGDQVFEGDGNIDVAGTIDFPSVTLPISPLRRIVAFDNTANAQTIRFLVDDANFLALPDKVLLMVVRCTSTANNFAITTNVADSLRSSNYLATDYHTREADTVYLGYSRNKSVGLFLPIYKDGSRIFVDGPVREFPDDDFDIIPDKEERVLSTGGTGDITEEVSRRVHHKQTIKVASGTHVFTMPSPLTAEDVTMFFWNSAGTLTVNGVSVPATKFATLVLLGGEAKVTVEP